MLNWRPLLVALLGAGGLLAPGVPAYANLLAFPGAVGQGASATGGRGGDVYRVTNLLDYGAGQSAIAGSLRYGIESASGPRTIVFDVGGGIQLARPLLINKSDLTLAGQTSPTGVTLWGYPTELENAQNVIVRFMRFRTGDFNAQLGVDAVTPAVPTVGKGNMDLLADMADGFGIMNVQRVVVDHISAAWSMDETLPVTLSRDVTVQHSMINESLDSVWHWKGYTGTAPPRDPGPPYDNPSHGLGSLVRGIVTTDDQAAGIGGYTFYGNLWSNHTGRNPHLGGEQGGSRRGDFNMVNNVVYNWWYQPTAKLGGRIRVNHVGNYYIDGPSSTTNSIFQEGSGTTVGDTLVYQFGNARDADKDDLHDGAVLNAAQVAQMYSGFETGELNAFGTGAPFNFFNTVADHVTSAEEAYQRIVAAAGASLWRDALDLRYIDELTTRTARPGYTTGYPGYGVHPGILISQDHLGVMVDGQLHIPGIDDLLVSSRDSTFDTDGDGMPDYYELAAGLDPDDPGDGNLVTLSAVGYTNLEMYLNSLVTGLFPWLLTPGDFNFDGQVTNTDIQAMLDALVDLSGYRTIYGLDDSLLAVVGDIDGNGVLTNADIQAFLNALTVADGRLVPEPTAAGLLLLLLPMMRRRRA